MNSKRTAELFLYLFAAFLFLSGGCFAFLGGYVMTVEHAVILGVCMILTAIAIVIFMYKKGSRD